MAWLYKQSASENWWIGYRLNGRQYLRSTKTSDRKKAEQELAKLNAVDQAHKAGSLTGEFVALLTRKTSTGEALRGYIRQWLGECKDLSEATLKKYRAIPEEFCLYMNATETAPLLRDIQPDTVGAFLREKRAKTSTATAKHVRRVLSAFFNYAVDNRALPFSPVPSSRALKLTRDSKAVRRAFTLAELQTLFDKCPSDFWRYMVMAGFYCGQRMGDLICLPWGAVDFDQNQIRLVQSKTGKNIAVPMRAELGKFLNDLKSKAETVKTSSPIWPAAAERYEKFGAAGFSNEFYDVVLLPAGLVTARKQSHHKKKEAATNGRRKVNSVSFHCLRHTFVSLLKLSGASQATAKELAGHSSDAISDLYTHIPEAELNRAIKQLPEIQPQPKAEK
jgi:integrase